MPYLEKGGLKSQVIIPKHSRNPYDIGSRLLGVEVVEKKRRSSSRLRWCHKQR